MKFANANKFDRKCEGSPNKSFLLDSGETAQGRGEKRRLAGKTAYRKDCSIRTILNHVTKGPYERTAVPLLIYPRHDERDMGHPAFVAGTD